MVIIARCQTTMKPVVLGYLSILRSILISQCLRVNTLTLNMMKTRMQAMRPLLVVPGMATRPPLVVPGMATRHLVAKPSGSVRKGAQTSSAPSGKNLRSGPASGLPTLPVHVAKGYDNNIGCILRELVNLNEEDSRSKSNEPLATL